MQYQGKSFLERGGILGQWGRGRGMNEIVDVAPKCLPVCLMAFW